MDDTDPVSLITFFTHPQLSIYIGFPVEAIISLLVIIFLLVLSGLISGSEIAFFSLSPSEHLQLLEEKTKSYKTALNLLHVPKKLLAAILISNNFLNISIVLLSTIFTQSVFDFSANVALGLVIQVFVITSIILLFGEIMPKILAKQKTLLFINLMAIPLEFVMIAFKPLISLLSTTTNLIDKRLAKHKPQLSMKELSEAIELTGENENNSIEEEDQKILKGIATFGDTDVKEIMKARVDVKAIEKTAGFKEVINHIQEWGYSRIPIYKDNLDQIEGILYIKDLLSSLEFDEYNWQTKIRPAFFVPENKKINDLLQEFRRKKIHLAIVVDEYGGTSGIVSLEDVLEEIVGEISDEFDVDNAEFIYKQVNSNTWVFEAKSGLLDVCKVIDIDSEIFDDVKGESDSLAGLILELKGNFPDEGEKILFENIEFKILRMEQRRISRIRIRKIL